jgi:hypothetical protein
MTTPVFPVKSRKCRSEIREKGVECSNPRLLRYERTTEPGGPDIFRNKPLKIRDRLLLVFTQQKICMVKIFDGRLQSMYLQRLEGKDREP